MKQIRLWVSKLSIRKKLILYSYLIITPILLLISVFLFVQKYHSAKQSETDTCFQNVQALSDGIEAMQVNIAELGTYICINNEIQNILRAENTDKLNEDAKLWLNNAPMQIIEDMVAINGQIKTVALYPENGVRPYLRCMDASAYLSDISMVRETDIYNRAVEKRGKIVWQRVGTRLSDTYESNRNDKIVMYREIYDLSKKHKLGYLAIGASSQKFDELCRNALREEREAVLVYCEDGLELMRAGTVTAEILDSILCKEQSGLGKGPEDNQWVEDNYVVYRCKNEDTGIVIYKLVPIQSMGDMIKSLVASPLFLLLGVLIGLLPIMMIISNLISKPLRKLCQAMDKFKEGDFSQKVEVETGDELGEAAQCFNGMVDDIRELINQNYVMELRERQSELDTLQAQINPHFLYNTLDSLYWRILETGDEDVAEDILALSELFRLVLGRGEGIVTVQNEMELLERYLQIQKMRFGKRLDYRIKMEDTIRDERIPKLILQPFVENAIVHGFEKVGQQYALLVKGIRENNYMIFHIEDTGVGMSKEQVQSIWDETEERKYSSQRVGKYAIKNVKERLELRYHGDFELDIQSEEGYGTHVVIKIPCGEDY